MWQRRNETGEREEEEWDTDFRDDTDLEVEPKREHHLHHPEVK